MTHIDIIRDLAPQIKESLHKKSNSKGLRHLASHIGALALMAGYIALQGPFWGLMLLPYGITMMFLFTLSHECTHATPFAAPWLSTWVGHAVSLPMMLPFIWFRYFHLAHHKYTNDLVKDPELEGAGRPDTWHSYLIYLSGWGYWTGMMRTLWRNAFGEITAPYLPRRKYPEIRREARVLLAVYAVMILSLTLTPAILWLWLLPALIGQPFLRLYLLAEHGHCPPVADMLENTRTTLTTRLIRALAWNMPYHAEHHAMPMVPFHHLPALHKHMAPHLKSVSAGGYSEFSAQYVKQLKTRSSKHPRS